MSNITTTEIGDMACIIRLSATHEPNDLMKRRQSAVACGVDGTWHILTTGGGDWDGCLDDDCDPEHYDEYFSELVRASVSEALELLGKHVDSIATDLEWYVGWADRLASSYAEEVSFGALEDYYTAEECTVERKADWQISVDAWNEAIEIARDTVSHSVKVESLREASRIEREWGDDPNTRRIAAIIGVEY